MQRITISIDDGLTELFDRHMETHAYTNRSEAMRDLVRDGLMRSAAIGAAATHGVASLSFVVDSETRELPKRLMRAQLDNHDLLISMNHVPLDHERSLCVAILRGPIKAVQAFADGLLSQRGLSHGALHLIPVTLSSKHRHVGTHHSDGTAHAHFKTIA